MGLKPEGYMAILLGAEAARKRVELVLGISDEDAHQRRSYIGGSDANTLLSGDLERIHNLWLEKTGQKEPDDLSDNLAVQMGTWTEDLNLYWWERQTGEKVRERNIQKSHKEYTFIKARADGETTIDGQPAVIDAKHVGAFYFDADQILERYAPQLTLQMSIIGVKKGVISCFVGSNRWEPIYIDLDPLYEAQVISACVDFWGHVVARTPPVEVPKAKLGLPTALLRDVDMSASNEWGALEDDYLNTEAQAKTFEAAKKGLKGLVADDVRTAAGRHVTIKRDKNGNLRFSRTKGSKS